MDCLMPVEGGELAHLLNEWPEMILAKCYENMCNPAQIREETEGLEFYPVLAAGCPVVENEDNHTDDCTCAGTLRDLAAELRSVDAMLCEIPTEDGMQGLLDWWVPTTMEKCEHRRLHL